MAGYIGSKTSVTQVDGYNRTDADAEFVNDPNSVISVSGSNVGIGTSSPAISSKLNVESTTTALDSGGTVFASVTDAIAANIGGQVMMGGYYTGTTTCAFGGFAAKKENATDGNYAGYLQFITSSHPAGNTEKMRIDSSGNLLVGQSSSTQPGVGNTTTGFGIRNNGLFFASAYNGRTGTFSRSGTDGPILGFYKDGSSVGSIGNASADSIYIAGNGSAVANLAFGGSSVIYPTVDNVGDVGAAGLRFDDIYATNATIQTSDRNEKQDIEVLSDAEQRVAVSCKGLLRKFRWIDAVTERGDDARIHFGIIAQDLQDAFAAEGLDAGRYAMFISSTWWETQTEVPAVEAVEAVYEDVVIPAVLDEDGNEVEAERTEQQLVTEAVEAKEAYTRTDTYETLEEVPEGATERTRLGVRYPELLAFIIGAM